MYCVIILPPNVELELCVIDSQTLVKNVCTTYQLHRFIHLK